MICRRTIDDTLARTVIVVVTDSDGDEDNMTRASNNNHDNIMEQYRPTTTMTTKCPTRTTGTTKQPLEQQLHNNYNHEILYLLD